MFEEVPNISGDEQHSVEPSADRPVASNADSTATDSPMYTPAESSISVQGFCSSDQTAASAGGTRPMDSVVASCGSQICSPPCDIDDLVLNEIPGSKETQYRVEDWSFVAEPPQASKRAICLTGVSGVQKARILQVVGDRPGVAASTQIRAYVYTFATCGSSHVEVTVLGPHQTDIDQIFSAQGTFDFPVTRYESGSLAGRLFERIITIGVPPARYFVDATSCGNRNGQQAYIGGELIVEVYPNDQYQLSLYIPPLRKKTYSYSKKREYTSENTTTTETTVRDEEFSTSTDTMRNVSRRHRVKYDRGQKEDDEKPKIELKRNGQADDISADLTKLVEILENVKGAVSSIQEVLHDWVPQVGFKFEFELSFFAGKIMIAGGWKEWTDWRVYYALSAAVSITLIKISLILSFGIKVGPATARLEGGIDDASVKLDEQYNFNSPDKQVSFDISAPIEIPAVLRGRAEADIYIVKVSYAAGIRTGFDGKGGFKMVGKCSCYAEVKWQGVTAFVSSSGPTSGEEENVVELVRKKDIYSGEF